MINRLKTSQSRNFLLIPGNTPQILPAKDSNSQNQEEPQNDKNTQTAITDKKNINPRNHNPSELNQSHQLPHLPKNITGPKAPPNAKAPRRHDIKPPSDPNNSANPRKGRNLKKASAERSIYAFLDRNSSLPSLGKGSNEKYSNITPIAIQLLNLANIGIQYVSSNQKCINILTDKNELLVSQTVINEERNSKVEFNIPPNFNQLKILSVSCGIDHTVVCAMKEPNFYVLGVGSNSFGQLGFKKEIDSVSQFRQIMFPNKPRFAKVCCGNYFTFLLTDTAQLYSFGQNKYGQLGLGLYEDIISTPTFCNSLNGAPIIDVACGMNHTLALSSTGLVFAAGSNDQGQLGISSQSNQQIFQIVDTLANVYIVSISAYDNFSAAIDEFGTLYVWGGKWGFRPQPLNIETSDNGKNRNEKIVDVALGLDGRIAVLTTNNKLILSGYYVNEQQISKLVDIVSPHSPFVKLFSGGQYFFALTSTSKSLPLLSSEIKKEDQNNSLLLIPPQPNEIKGRLRSSKRLLTLNSSHFPSVLSSPKSTQVFSLVFSSLSAINTSFVIQNFTEVMANDSCGIDVDGVINAYNLLLDYKDLLSTLTNSFNNLLNQLLHNPPVLRRPTNMRFLLIGLLHPSINIYKEGCEFWGNLTSMIEKLNAKSILKQWLSALNSGALSRILQSLKDFLTYQISNEDNLYSPELIKSVKTIDIVYNASSRTKKLPFDNFYHDEINKKIDLDDEYKLLMQNKELSKHTFDESRLSWCYTESASWLLNADTKTKFIRVYSKAKWTQRMEQQRPFASFGPYRFFREEDLFFFLNVNRGQVLEDTFNQIFELKNPKSELKKKLRVKFENEPAVDAGGVQREFFELVVNEMLDQKFNLFLPKGSFYYFNKNLTDEKSLQMYKLAGIIIGLGIYNGNLINIRFPTIVYKKLKKQNVGFNDLSEFDPQLHKTLENILNYQGDIENDMCLTFEYGDVPLIEGGADIPVTKGNRTEYVDAVSNYVLSQSVEAQFNKFREGFLQCTGNIVLKLFRPEELALLIAGREDLDFYALMKATKYDGGYDEDSPAVKAFWRIVFTRLTDEEKKKLLYFVTASPRAPIGGLGEVPFVIARDGDRCHIPTSHTCAFMLVLPDEPDEDKLYQKLLIAIDNSEGFAFK